VGKKSRDKGYRTEAALVQRLRAAGIPAERVPLSGGAGGSFAGDVRLWAPIGIVCGLCDGRGQVGFPWHECEECRGTGLGLSKLTAESKARREGWKTLRKWLGENDCLVLKADRAEPLWVFPESVAIRLLGGSESE